MWRLPCPKARKRHRAAAGRYGLLRGRHGSSRAPGLPWRSRCSRAPGQDSRRSTGASRCCPEELARLYPPTPPPPGLPVDILVTYSRSGDPTRYVVQATDPVLTAARAGELTRGRPVPRSAWPGPQDDRGLPWCSPWRACGAGAAARGCQVLAIENAHRPREADRTVSRPGDFQRGLFGPVRTAERSGRRLANPISTPISRCSRCRPASTRFVTRSTR